MRATVPRLRVTNSFLLFRPMPHTSIVFFLISPFVSVDRMVRLGS
jgi:hypothetical protein